MNFFAADLLGYSIATCAAVIVLLAPGALVAKALANHGPPARWSHFAPALAVAIFPVLDACAIRVFGVPVAAAIRLCLAAAAILFAREMMPRPGRIALAGIGAWWLYLAVLYLDVDAGNALYRSITVLDLVKHAAVVREIENYGLPLHDPFFARDAVAGYYHYFYDGAAIVGWLGGRLVDARMAFAGAAFATGIAMATLLRALIVDLGWQKVSDAKLTGLTILACALGGFDLIGVALRWLLIGRFEQNPQWWDDEISFFTTSAAWVPHHLAGVISCFVALVLLSKAISRPKSEQSVVVLASSFAMASAFGLSIWVTIGSAIAFVVAFRFLKPGERMPWLALLAMTCILALALSAMQIADLLQGRQNTGLPIGPWIREPAKFSELAGFAPSPLLSLFLTPLVWIVEFGPFAIGSGLFWKHCKEAGSQARLQRLLLACAVSGLLGNLLLHSLIINNDFGWRVIWFTALPAMVWTITVLQNPLPGAKWKWAMNGAIAMGLATTAFAIVFARIPPSHLPQQTLDFINTDPQLDLALREAYSWANHNLPAKAVIQHNPAAAPRSFGFGLYSRNRVMVADRDAQLFGATREDVGKRVEFFSRIFAGSRSISNAGSIHLLVTARDPLWARLDKRECLYLSPLVCITKARTT